MQDLFNSRAMIYPLESQKASAQASPTTDAASAAAIDYVIAKNELFNVRLTKLKENVIQLELTTKKLPRLFSKIQGVMSNKM